MTFSSLWDIYQWLTSSPGSQKVYSRAACVRDHTPEFLSLPNELLVDVLSRLDCSSIFSARMTCRRLCNLTKTRHLWRSVITRLQQEGGLVPPEEGMSDYEVEELERWILRRSLAHSALQSELPAHSHARLVNFRIPGIDDSVPPEPFLLPGGRWLLLADASSRMHGFDLDAVNPTPTCLFSLLDFDRELILDYVRYTFWIDYSSPCLSFHVAGNALNPDHSRTIVYTVKLTGHGASASLTASLVSAFRSYGHKGWYLGRFALNSRHYVEVRRDPSDSKIQDILAYQFQEACGGRGYDSIKPAAQFRFSGNKILATSFVYDDVLAVCTSGDALRLYEIAHPASPGKPSGSFCLLHTIPFAHESRSDIRWSPLESYMVSISFDGGFRGLRIPHNKATPPTVVELGKHNTFVKQEIGFNFGTSVSVSMGAHDDPVEIVSHPWIQAGDGMRSLDCLKQSSNGPKVPHLCARSELAGFSEDLGRLLIFRDGSQSSMVVVDLTPAHYLHE